jgi:hypothetical protein
MLGLKKINRSQKFDFALTNKEVSAVKLADEVLNDINAYKNNKDNLKHDFMLCMLANLQTSIKSGYMLTIAKSPKSYSSQPKRYRYNHATFRIVVPILNKMIEAGYLDYLKGIKIPKYKHGLLSKISPSEKFIKTLSLLKGTEPRILKPNEPIVLRERSKKARAIEYSDSPEVQLWRENVVNYNSIRGITKVSLAGMSPEEIEANIGFLGKYAIGDFRNSTSISLTPTYATRIFNGSFEQGGRFYNCIETIMPKTLRPLIQINDQPTVELDYSSYHIRMLYHLEGIDYRDNAYSDLAEGDETWTSIYKKIGLINLNSKSRTSTLRALRSAIREKSEWKQAFDDLNDATLSPVLDRWLEKHSSIVNHFNSDKGLLLQRYDSDIADSILKHFWSKGVCVLCVHDSFIIQADLEDELREVMTEAYVAKAAFKPVITVK